MRQEVNLYQPLFQRAPALLSMGTSVIIVALLALALLGIHGYDLWQHGQRQAELAALESRHQRAAELLAQATAADPGSALAVEAEIEALRQLRSGKERLLTAMTSLKLGNARGFTEFLSGLARQRVDGLWLTGVRIDHGGERLTLKGQSLAPEGLPRLLARLGRESAFRGRTFRTLDADRHEPAAALRFTVSTARRDET